jgi:hypothetical protein
MTFVALQWEEIAMQLGFNLPISGPNSNPLSLVQIAQEGEAMGYDYLTLRLVTLTPRPASSSPMRRPNGMNC